MAPGRLRFPLGVDPSTSRRQRRGLAARKVGVNILARRYGLRDDCGFGGPPCCLLSPRSRRPIRHTAHIACQVVRERDFRLVADRVANLSLNGMLVGPADPVLTGEKIIDSFPSPVDGLWIDAQATVTLVLHGRRPGEYRRALGLEFDVLDDGSTRLGESACVVI